MSSPARPRRSRSTYPVLADLPGRERWWLEGSSRPQPRVRQKSLRFHSGDPFDRFTFLRYLCIALSLILPAIILTRAKLWVRTPDPNLQVGRPLSASEQDIANFYQLKAQLEKQPHDPETLRSFAAVASKWSPAEARRCFHRLNQMGKSTDADCVGHAALLASLHDFTGAKAVLSNLPKAAQELPQAQAAWLSIWREAGDFTAAAVTLEKINATSPCGPEIALDLVDRAARGGATGEILQRLESSLLVSLRHWMSMGRAQEVLAIADALATAPISAPQHRAQIAQILRNLPGAPVQHRLAAVRFAYPLELAASEQQMLRNDYQNEIAWSGGMSAEEKSRVADYLKVQGEHALISTIISEREALSEPPLFARRFDALLEQGLWRQAGTLTSAPNAPLLPFSRGLAQALASLQNRTIRTYSVEIMLRDALANSRQESRALDCYATGCAALDHAMTDLAANAFATALDISMDRSRTLKAILHSARQGRLPLAVFIRALSGSPALQDPSIQDSLTYLSLLSDQQTETALAEVRQRRETQPANVYLRFLEALALHQQGNHLDAKSLLIPLPRHRWHQGEAAVLASIISAAGEVERSSSLIQQIDSSLLFEEERAIFEPWQSRFTLGRAVASSSDAE